MKERKISLIHSYTIHGRYFTKKTKIVINLDKLNSYITDLGFLGLIFGGRGLEKHRRIADDDDMTNILSLNVLNLFDNLQTMVMRNVDDYPISLHQLVLLLADKN